MRTCLGYMCLTYSSSITYIFVLMHPVIEALLAAYLGAARQKDSGGDLPIHLACREKADAAVIFALLLKDPATDQTADDEGRLPIHLACRQQTPQTVVDRLLVAHHRASKTADAYGLLPLH